MCGKRMQNIFKCGTIYARKGLAAVPVHYRATELCIKVSKPFCERQETLNSSPERKFYGREK